MACVMCAHLWPCDQQLMRHYLTFSFGVLFNTHGFEEQHYPDMHRISLKPSQGCDYGSMPQCLAFYMVSEDLNSGPYAGVAGTLPTEPFPQSSECYLG